MATRETIIIVAVFGVLSAIFVLFMVGVTRALDPYPQREADLQRLAVLQREDDVAPKYVNDAAIVSVKEGQKSGPVIVTNIEPDDTVKIDLLQANIGGTNIVPTILRVGDKSYSCEYQEIRLVNVTADVATFKFVRGGYCPICWHMYRGEI